MTAGVVPKEATCRRKADIWQVNDIVAPIAILFCHGLLLPLARFIDKPHKARENSRMATLWRHQPLGLRFSEARIANLEMSYDMRLAEVIWLSRFRGASFHQKPTFWGSAKNFCNLLSYQI